MKPAKWKVLMITSLAGCWLFGNPAPAQAEEAKTATTKVESNDPPKERGRDDQPPVAKGTVVGTVKAKGSSWLEVASLSGATERYVAKWTAKGADKDMAKAISQLAIGDQVEIKWFVNDHVRIDSLRVLSAGTGKKSG